MRELFIIVMELIEGILLRITSEKGLCRQQGSHRDRNPGGAGDRSRPRQESFTTGYQAAEYHNRADGKVKVVISGLPAPIHSDAQRAYGYGDRFITFHRTGERRIQRRPQ